MTLNGIRASAAVIIVAVGIFAVSATSTAQKIPASATATGVPSFLEVNGVYSFRWQPGDVERYKVLEIKDGWVKAESQTKDAPARMVLWVNPAQAMTIKPEP
jgi:hypothetical protein